MTLFSIILCVIAWAVGVWGVIHITRLQRRAEQAEDEARKLRIELGGLAGMIADMHRNHPDLRDALHEGILQYAENMPAFAAKLQNVTIYPPIRAGTIP